MEIYKYRYMPGHGYLVYRDIFDHDKCTIEEGAIVHKEATFVDEQDAVAFCLIKNNQLKYGAPDILPYAGENEAHKSDRLAGSIKHRHMFQQEKQTQQEWADCMSEGFQLYAWQPDWKAAPLVSFKGDFSYPETIKFVAYYPFVMKNWEMRLSAKTYPHKPLWFRWWLWFRSYMATRK